MLARSVVSLLLLSVSVRAQDQKPFSVRLQADYVRVPLTALDASNRPVTDLDAAELQVFENGRPRSIVNFIRDQGPAYVALLIDSSGSVQGELRELKRSAEEFVRHLTDQDRICVAVFSSDVELLQDWTNNKRKVRRSLKGLGRGFRTALYDALYALASEQLKKVEGKRAIILLTDGMENDSRMGLEEVRRTLLRESIALYVVSKTRLLESEIQKSERVQFLQRALRDVTGASGDFAQWIVQRKEQQMIELAETTGGRIFFPDTPQDYRGVYQEVARELKQQYLLTYVPTPGERDLTEFKKIEISYPDKGTRLVYRRGYY